MDRYTDWVWRDASSKLQFNISQLTQTQEIKITIILTTELWKISIISNSPFISSFLNKIGHNSGTKTKETKNKGEIKWYDIFGKFALQ